MNEDLKKEIARVYKLADSGSLYADGKRDGIEILLHFMGLKFSIEEDGHNGKIIKWEN
tara:strand:- start:506 stop:679 length:174 start_codon:yes stop_codon:yes gene_type:complete